MLRISIDEKKRTEGSDPKEKSSQNNHFPPQATTRRFVGPPVFWRANAQLEKYVLKLKIFTLLMINEKLRFRSPNRI